jgi:PRC-barrel domain
MKTLLTTTALVAFLSAGPVFAAEDTTQMNDQAPATQDMTTDAPAATDQMAPAPDATAPAVAADQDMSQTDTMAPDADTDTMATDQMAPAPDVAANNEVYIPTQASEEDLASNWIGKSLYNGSDENLGDINDILIGQDGNIRAVIVGVGGFLGIGEKDVAVSFNAIEPRADENGDVTLYLNATQEQLESAPEFETLADARARSAADQPVVDPAAPAPAQ